MHASSVPVPSVAITTTSPKRAVSLNELAATRPPASATKSASFSGVREPIITSLPSALNARANDLPTTPEPRIPIFMGWSLSRPNRRRFHRKGDEGDEEIHSM